ncbi:MAG: glycosyltransferase family 4 protein [Rhodothermales bacterium]
MRSVLYIAYYFPPSGGSGVQRTLKFVKYLPASGWSPRVLTVAPESAAYPDLDPAMAGEVPASIDVIRTGAWDPYSWYGALSGKSKSDAVTVGFLSDKPPGRVERLARWVRANLFIPDARVGWVPYATRAGAAAIAAHRPDVLLTTGPPHSTHLIGRALHRRFGIPWVADFRDPWTDIDYLDALPMSAWASRRNRALEQSVLDEAQCVVTVSPAVQRAFAARTATPCVNIYNGYDEADFDQEPFPDTGRFVITHVGNMNADRNPHALWRALAALQNPDVEVRLVGNVDARVREEVSRLGLDGQVVYLPYMPHREAVRHVVSSQVLLLAVNRVRAANDIIPGKVFEYLASQRPVLVLGPPDGETAQIVLDAGAGAACDYEDVAGVTTSLQRWVAAWRDGTPARGATAEAAARYSRRAQAGELADLLTRLSMPR